METPSPFYIGCASSSLWASYADQFPTQGTHLERYAGRFQAVEINSSFYRPHKPQTYAKWAASVPENFRFAVKVPKLITHQQRLKDARELLERFLNETSGLGPKLGPLLVQLPPSLSFDETIASEFFTTLREQFAQVVVCEPRHTSWFTPRAQSLLVAFEVARVAASPALMPDAGKPGGWDGLIYYRLHGVPRLYYSAYDSAFLEDLAIKIEKADQNIPVWCIFDNTAAGAATGDALTLMKRLIPDH